MLKHHQCLWWFLLLFSIGIMIPYLEGVVINKKNDHQVIKTKTYMTPFFTLKPGHVVERFFYNTNFPEGHIAIKSFDVEVVDEEDNPIPLFETYLHHWGITRYYQHKDSKDPNINTSFTQLQEPNFIIAGNSGVCQKHALPHFFGTGAESRKTSSFLPHPYGIEVGNEKEVPLGYEEKWVLNIHAIDTRGVEDRIGCIECKRHLYNVTKDGLGMALEDDYIGGLRCCYDQTQCKVKKGYENKLGDDQQRNLYVRYTVKWVDWDDDLVIPLKVYIFDITDTWKPLMDSTGAPQQHNCLVEYNVGGTCSTNKVGDECNATKMVRLLSPSSGYIIYGMAHLHVGGLGSVLYGQDGRELCSSSPIYGNGSEIGNEKGYVVGMSTCYPKPGSVKLNNKEMLTLISKYHPSQTHIGVMGLFHIMVAQKLPNSIIQMEPLKQLANDRKKKITM
uniref:Stress up-regulated Nod 19 protein n=1 Tax=Cucumis sativus TaxID=3659 RepID=A0A0A0K2U1_CUCSA